MGKHYTRMIVVLLMLTFVLPLSGCTGNNAGKGPAEPSAQSETAVSSQTAVNEVKEPVAVKAGLVIHSQDNTNVDLPWLQEFMKRTNIKLEILPMEENVAEEKRNLMLASGDIPDLISVNSVIANAYGEDGAFLPVDDLMKENAPELSALITVANTMHLRNPQDGKLYFIPIYYGLSDTSENTFNYRKDILDDLGLPEPETMDDWYNTFKKVKEKYPEIIPLCERHRWLDFNATSAFDMAKIYQYWGMIGSQMDQKKIVYLPATENWKQFLMYFNKLYTEGLLDKEYLTIQYTDWWDAKIAGGKAFACWTMNFNRAWEASSADVQWTTAKYPKNQTGNRQQFLTASPWVDNGMAISSKSKVQKEAMKALNYFYTDEGNILKQYGLEGVTYKKDGERLVRLPEGDRAAFDKKMTEIGTMFYWPYMSKVEEQVDLTQPIIKDHFDKNPQFVVRMPVLAPTSKAGTDELNSFLNDLITYTAEMMDKFVIGKESFDHWEAYVKELERLKANRGSEIVQEWLNNYYSKVK